MTPQSKNIITAKASDFNRSAVSYVIGGLGVGDKVTVKAVGEGNVQITVRANKPVDLSRIRHRIDFSLTRGVSTSWMPLGLGLADTSRRSHHLHKIKINKKIRERASAKDKLKAVYEWAISYMAQLDSVIVETGREQFFQFDVGGDLVLTNIYKTPIMYKENGQGEYIHL
jgi:hypothetical protein